MNEYSVATLRTLRQLRWASIVEGGTLLALVGIAVPLKHLAGWPGAVSVMGPVHGLAFLAYVWLAINLAAGAGWRARDVARVLGAALVPCGGFFTARWLRQWERSLRAAPNQPAQARP